jgi:adenylate cyclase
VQQVGQELGVRYVLEGSVRKSTDKVRVTAQLIDASTGDHVWAERFDEEAADVVGLQEEVGQ